MTGKLKFHRAAVIGILGVSAIFAAACSNDPSMPPSDPPSVSTGSALTIGEHAATVGGRVDPRGSRTTYWFEFGPDPEYGWRSDAASLPASPGGARSVAASLEGLAPSTPYHYRLVAQNEGGLVRGGDATLVTLDPNRPPDTFLTAASTDTTNSTVSWHLYWFGTDAEGVVSSYRLRVADHGADGAIDPPDTLGLPWTSTIATDTLLRWEEGLGGRTAFVRAVDDRGAWDPTPASISVRTEDGRNR